jgi:hypothetical protein
VTNTIASELVLTPHPLQRIGAYALAALAGCPDPGKVTGEAFDQAVGGMTDDAVRAALGKDTKVPSGFWLKSSLSLFPNSPMNHPSNGKKHSNLITAGVERWRRPPDRDAWPSAPCALCGRPAVRFYGKVDVPLAESDVYRNSTPRGHEGMALCWPCVCSFHALPYGCHLTGGPAIALHSWDERFLSRTVRDQVRYNRRYILVGRGEPVQPPSGEALALQVLREYSDSLDAGIELMIFSNNNRGQTLDIHSMGQPLAEWLRRTMRSQDQKQGFSALLQAHRTKDRAGAVALARNVFRSPGRVIGTAGRYLAGHAGEGVLRPETGRLTALCFDYVTEVLGMDESSLKEVRALADRVATLLNEESSAGKLKEFYSTFQQSARLRSWLRRRALDWTLDPRTEPDMPLVTTRGYELLFDPGIDTQAWFHRELFLIAVLEGLHERRWRPVDAAQVVKELRDDDDELDPADRSLLREEEGQ